jgi:hypothetical protein
MKLSSDRSKALSKNAAGVVAKARRRTVDPFDDEWDEFVIRFDRESGQFDISTVKTDDSFNDTVQASNAKKAA